MKNLHRSSVALITTLVAVANSAYGQQPPDVVVSDGLGNTAMGTNALFNLTPIFSATRNQPLGFQLGVNNTAAGAEALYANTTGFYNSAFGAAALAANTTGTIFMDTGQVTSSYAPPDRNTTGALRVYGMDISKGINWPLPATVINGASFYCPNCDSAHEPAGGLHF